MRSWSDQSGSSISVSVIAEVVRKRSNGIATTSSAEADGCGGREYARTGRPDLDPGEQCDAEERCQ